MSPLVEEPHSPAERRASGERARNALRPSRPAPTATASSKQRPYRRLLLIGLTILLVVGTVVGGLEWWIGARQWVSTDDAFIDVHMVQVSSQVAGRVERVRVNDNEEVHAGQILVKLNPADFRVKLDQAIANRESAAGTLAQAKAQLPVAEANLGEAQAQVEVAQAAATNAEINLRRALTLQRGGSLAITQQQVDNDTATARSDRANLAAAKQKATAAAALLALDKTNIETAAAGVRAAAALLEEAQLNLSYTKIRAGVAGRIAKLSVAPGDYIQTGQNLMALVPKTVWVTANFKETDLNHMKVGDPVDVYIDAYPGHVFHGRVQSIQAGSGAAFSLLPPENATGNYVKVVQRVPVKIVFTGNPGSRWLLGPGMSVEPYVKIR